MDIILVGLPWCCPQWAFHLTESWVCALWTTWLGGSIGDRVSSAASINFSHTMPHSDKTPTPPWQIISVSQPPCFRLILCLKQREWLHHLRGQPLSHHTAQPFQVRQVLKGTSVQLISQTSSIRWMGCVSGKCRLFYTQIFMSSDRVSLYHVCKGYIEAHAFYLRKMSIYYAVYLIW